MWLDYSSGRFDRSYRLHFQGLAVLLLNREVRWTNGLFEFSTLKTKATGSFKTSGTTISTKQLNISEDLNIKRSIFFFLVCFIIRTNPCVQIPAMETSVKLFILKVDKINNIKARYCVRLTTVLKDIVITTEDNNINNQLDAKITVY